jgi:hypothetical protein
LREGVVEGHEHTGFEKPTSELSVVLGHLDEQLVERQSSAANNQAA